MEKKNNKIIIILMGVIIVILAVLCILFATKTITLNINKNNNSMKNVTNTTDNTDTILSNSEAEDIVTNLLTNEVVRRVLDNDHLPYCPGEQTSSDISLNENFVYSLCNDYNSYDEVINYIEQYFSESYYTNYLENKKTIGTKIIDINGEKIYVYYEKDGKLYTTDLNKGGNMDKIGEPIIKCSISNVNTTEINATTITAWSNGNDTWEEKATIKLVKDNNNWKIDLYGVE